MSHLSLRQRLALTAGAALAFATLASSAGGPAQAVAVGRGPADFAPNATGEVTNLPTFLPGHYIVVLDEKPVATYAGETAGLTRTKPAKGEQIDLGSAAARAYRGHLKDRQQRVAARVGATPDQHYSTALNGFTAELTGDQARELAQAPGVLSVTPDVLQQPLDDRSPTDFLQLSGKTGVWSELGGTKHAGEGVVVGIIDTGVWPESESFAGKKLPTKQPKAGQGYQPYRTGTTTVMQKADGTTFTGTCQTGEDFTAADCNSKLISARYYGDAWLEAVPPEARADYVSPRDGNGHGSHTASTSAGRSGVEATAGGIDFGKISGVAPEAKIAVYKALWEGKGGVSSGGATSDILSAIDQAVADNVDVINYSVGSIFESAHTDPIQLAFLSAASSGIFVAAAAGNSGPYPSTLDNTSPWVTTVAASTVASYSATVTLGNGQRYTGTSTSIDSRVGPAPLVTGAAVRTASATEYDANSCLPGTLDPAKTAGAIVTCERGVGARVAKSEEVERAGGAGMVLLNLTPMDELADSHAVPTVHLNAPGAVQVKEYAGQPSATATLAPSTETAPYPQIADFSSRGPSLSSSGDLLKPDLAAPGVNVLAAVAPPTNGDQDFAFYSGTSMASPHIAGLAALYLAVHPSWSPMAVKSALMTTAGDVKDAEGGVDGDPFARGAGEVRPTRMLEPGLVYDAGAQDWLGYLEGIGKPTGTGVPAIDPSDYNTPSIAVGQLLGPQTVKRRVTAVTPGIYRATVDLPGIDAVVSPSILSFSKAGETKAFTVRLTQDTAPSHVSTSGWLTWQGAGTTVRSPIAIMPTSVIAPTEVSGTGADGQVSFEVTSGSAGAPIRAYGAVSGPEVTGSTSASLPDKDLPDFPATVTESTKALQWTVQADDPSASLWAVLYKVIDGQKYAVSWYGNGSDRVTTALAGPAPGDYGILVMSSGEVPGTTSTPFTVQTNLIGPDAGTDLTVTPTESPVAGKPYQVTASWTGVPTDRHSVGYVEFPNRGGTVISLN
ncbi:S8 family peptidase [Nocardioides sp. LHG3406-4]|uniref:S8 family peptidase n=1 Tax=Nocardioides sp. LHG3406-4 TaxID=2804575 RepID=UPI003CED32E7